MERCRELFALPMEEKVFIQIIFVMPRYGGEDGAECPELMVMHFCKLRAKVLYCDPEKVFSRVNTSVVCCLLGSMM